MVGPLGISILALGLFVIEVAAITDGLCSNLNVRKDTEDEIKAPRSDAATVEVIRVGFRSQQLENSTDPLIEEIDGQRRTFSWPNCGSGGHRFQGTPIYPCGYGKKKPRGNSESHGNLTAEPTLSPTDDADSDEKNSSKRIAGGFYVAPAQFPSFANLRLDSYDLTSIFCGGTIIGDNVIITAAHCMGEPKANLTFMRGQVVVGWPGDPREVGIAKLCRYSDYRIVFRVPINDIGIVILDQKLTFDQHVQPACLPTRLPQKAADCFVVGAGVTGDFIGGGVKAIPVKRDCPFLADLWDHRFCVRSINGAFYGDSCKGDSGGPIYCFDTCNGPTKQVSIGGVSYGAPVCNRNRKPSYNANFFNLRHQISDLINKC